MTTMQDVADLAGVSAKTVSRVFNDDAHISVDTRRKVEIALKELDYVPNMLARTFREGKTSVAAIAVPDIADPFFGALVRAIDEVAQSHSHALVTTSLGRNSEREQPIIEALLRRQIDGLVVAPISADHSYLKKWQSRLPIVFIDREPVNVAADLFIEDDRGGATVAVLHLTERGHRLVAFIGDSVAVDTTKRRLEGYRAALEQSGIPFREDLVVLTEPEDAVPAIRGLLGSPGAPTALFSSNSRTSVEIFPALQSLGRNDIALVSFGDFPMAAALQPSVTVIDQDPDRLGRAAAGRLFARLAAPKKRFRRRNVFDVALIQRQSSALSPASST